MKVRTQFSLIFEAGEVRAYTRLAGDRSFELDPKINGFPVSNTDDLRELMLAIGASGPCAATPTALERFLEFHPTARAFLAAQKTPASFATISYFGVGSFKFINAKGEGHYVRYQVVPEAGEQLLTDEEERNKAQTT